MDSKLLVTALETGSVFVSNFTKCLFYEQNCMEISEIEKLLDQNDLNEKIEGVKKILSLKETKKIYDTVWNTNVNKPVNELVDLVRNAQQTGELCTDTVNNLKKCIQETRLVMANETMSSFAKASAALFATEIFFLSQTWTEIKSAENIVEDIKLFEEIDQNFQDLHKNLKDLEELISGEMFDEAREALCVITICHTDTMGLLNKIELKNSLHSLNLSNKSSIRGVVSNGISTLTALHNLARLNENLNSWNRVFGFFTASLFAILTAYHADNYTLTNKRIDEIRLKVLEFEKKENDLRRIGKLIQKSRDFLKQKRSFKTDLNNNL
ncbi:unnamed protein product [Brachionus calyciflorus]|uniref:Uncharacterized protein n=1 Tax=Brachionus calyciflorus TaxID=104777 RepID=A0A814EV30_9BILA|nr:unnamed protein product [Brachionus calyciflorus]